MPTGNYESRAAWRLRCPISVEMRRQERNELPKRNKIFETHTASCARLLTPHVVTGADRNDPVRGLPQITWQGVNPQKLMDIDPSAWPL